MVCLPVNEATEMKHNALCLVSLLDECLIGMGQGGDFLPVAVTLLLEIFCDTLLEKGMLVPLSKGSVTFF